MQIHIHKSKNYDSNLSKDDSALIVFCTQMSALITAVQLRLPLLAKDQDIEILHQYRVSLRKIEALLIVFHNFVPKKILLNMQTDSRALFAATGQLRDLDLLLNKFQLEKLKSKQKLTDLTLIEQITAKRHDEFTQFLLTIQSSAYKNHIARLQACLSGVEQGSDHQSLQDCWSVLIKESMQKVHTAYQRLWKHKNELQIHKLRKKLKQLRYCIELVGVVVKPREAITVISWLKSHQESLGNYNDIHVQSALLKEYKVANKHIKRVLFTSDLSRNKKSLPLSKSDWKALKKKLHTMID